MKYKLLDLMMKDMKAQDILYKPTSFWQDGSKTIIDDFESNGIENFRALKSSQAFFAPCYSFPKYIENKDFYDKLADKLNTQTTDIKIPIKANRLYSGYLQAFSDYRTLVASDIYKVPFTDKVSESDSGTPIEHFEFNNRKFSRSFLNYLLGLNFLKKTVDTSEVKTVMEIGGGFGTLGEILLKDDRNDIFYINADIPPVAFTSTYYLNQIFGKDNIGDYENLHNLKVLDIELLKQQYKALNICSWQIPKLQGKIDLFVNFISFQEMEPDVVQNYCNYIEKLQPKYILLRNMLEGKQKQTKLSPMGVKEPILGDDYNKFLPNYEFIKSDSEIFGFITEDGFHSQLRIYQRKDNV